MRLMICTLTKYAEKKPALYSGKPVNGEA